MYFKITGIILTIFLGLIAGTFLDRKNLFKVMLQDYQKELAPAGKGGGPVVVTHALYLQMHESLENNVLTLHLFELINWNDIRLQWDVDSYNGETTLTIPSRLVWQPDLVLLNSVEQYTGFPSGDLNVNLFYDGNITSAPIRVSKTFCRYNMESLDRENVTCSLKYMSWSRSSDTLDVYPIFGTVQLDTIHTTNPKWEIVDTSAVRHNMTYPCCPPSVYPQIQYTIKLKRVR